MADFIIILVLAALAGLALRSCLRRINQKSNCAGNCSGCGCDCHRKDKH